MSDRETAIGEDRSSELMTLAPDPLGRFDEGLELVLLVLDGDNVAYDGDRKAALGAYGEPLQREVPGGLPDAGFELFDCLAVGGLRGYQAEDYDLAFGDVASHGI